MVRGIYTSSSGMKAQAERVSTISNNLANINTTAYKKEELILKEFPQMLIHRMNDKVVKKDEGSYDLVPIVGKLGTGVEINQKFVKHETGNLFSTSNPLDFAMLTDGFFSVDTDYGKMFTRNAELNLDKDGYVVTKDGYKVRGENGYINLKNKDFKIDRFGAIWSKEFDETQYQQVNQIEFFNFPDMKYVEKVGNSFYRETKYSGKPYKLDKYDTKLEVGYIETSNVNPIQEMVKLIEAQRSYEANAKALQSSDTLLGQAVNNVAKL